MTDCAQDRLARLEARALRLERAFVALAEFTHAGAGGPSLHLQGVVSVLLSAIRRDLAIDDKGQGVRG